MSESISIGSFSPSTLVIVHLFQVGYTVDVQTCNTFGNLRNRVPLTNNNDGGPLPVN